MSRVLVTGGCGFIGSHLVDKLLMEGFKVRVMDKDTRKDNIAHNLSNSNLEVFKGDVRRLEDCRKAVKGCSRVAHLAALISVDQSIEEPKPFWSNNVEGTFNILEASREEGVERFLYMSSCEVYGYIPYPDKADENYRLLVPRSPYAASKYAAEAYCQAYYHTYKLPLVIVRSFNAYGPRQNAGSRGAVIARFISQVLRDEVPTIYGDGSQTRDWTFVKDIAEGLFKALTTPGIEGEVFNICNGVERSVRKVLEKIIHLTGKDIEPKYREGRPGELKRSVGDYSKAKKILKWEPRTSFEEGLRETIEWFSKTINK